MKTEKLILVLAMVCVAALLAGCTESARQESAQIRWDEVLDQARLEAAQKSIEQGQLTFAEKILSEVRPESAYAESAHQMLSNLEVSQLTETNTKTF